MISPSKRHFSGPLLLVLPSLLLLISCPFGAAHAQWNQRVNPAATVASTLLPDAPSFQQSSSSETQSRPPPQETAAERKARLHEEAERQLKAQKSQRLLGVMPNFNTVLNGEAVPLTAAQKWNLAFHSALDPFYFASAFVLAGSSEVDDTHTRYHWGAKGYFKRAGANYADNVNGVLIGNALLPVLLHQDPRYFRKGTGPIKSRMLHAALSTFICKGDNGKTQFNISNVAGNFVSGAISNIYYPSDESGLELTLSNATAVTAQGALGALLLEFGPDLQNHLRHKK